MCFRWYSKMSKIIHVSLLSNVLQLVHCLTVTRFLLGRLYSVLWLRCEDLYSDDRTIGIYWDNNFRNRLFGAAWCSRDVGPNPPHQQWLSFTTIKKIVACTIYERQVVLDGSIQKAIVVGLRTYNVSSVWAIVTINLVVDCSRTVRFRISFSFKQRSCKSSRRARFSCMPLPVFVF